MKKLKFTLLTVALMVATMASAQVSLGIKGGLNMSNLLVNDDQNTENMKLGYHVGLAADYEFMPSMAIQTGLFFTTKGATIKNNDGSLEYTRNLMYLQVPVHFAYKVDVTPGTRVVFHAGPYLAYGVGGSYKTKVGTLNFQNDKIFGTADGQYKPFDAGLGLGVGAEFGPMLLDLGWDMGLVNISNTSTSVKNQNAYISVGYRFN